MERVNVRGVMVIAESGGIKSYIGKITDSPHDAEVSGEAMRAPFGLSEVTSDVAMATPAERVKEHPSTGLSTQFDLKGLIGAQRVQ